MRINDTTINAGAGAISGGVVSVIMSPLDVIKTRLQVARLPKDAAAEGLLGMMRSLHYVCFNIPNSCLRNYKSIV